MQEHALRVRTVSRHYANEWQSKTAGLKRHAHCMHLCYGSCCCCCCVDQTVDCKKKMRRWLHNKPMLTVFTRTASPSKHQMSEMDVKREHISCLLLLPSSLPSLFPPYVHLHGLAGGGENERKRPRDPISFIS